MLDIIEIVHINQRDFWWSVNLFTFPEVAIISRLHLTIPVQKHKSYVKTRGVPNRVTGTCSQTLNLHHWRIFSYCRSVTHWKIWVKLTHALIHDHELKWRLEEELEYMFYTKTFGIVYILIVYLLIMFIWMVFICT
jgi:hypothetical protein